VYNEEVLKAYIVELTGLLDEALEQLGAVRDLLFPNSNPNPNPNPSPSPNPNPSPNPSPSPNQVRDLVFWKSPLLSCLAMLQLQLLVSYPVLVPAALALTPG